MQTEEERFEKLYNEIIGQKDLVEKEKEKQKAIKKDNKEVFILTISFVLIGYIGFIALLMSTKDKGLKDLPSYLIPIAIVLVLSVIAIIVLEKKAKRRRTIYKEYKEYYIEKIAKRMLSEFCTIKEYKSDSGIDSEVYREADFEEFNSYKSDDYVKGIFNNKNFEMAEIHTSEESRDKYIELFYGLFFKVELSKEFKEQLYIRLDEYDTFRKSDIKEMNIDYLKLESSEFENKFNIYTSNQIMAAQLLTLDIMQILVEYSKEFDFEITIKNGYLYVRFFSKDIFDNDSLDKNILYKYFRILNFVFKSTELLQKNIEETQF